MVLSASLWQRQTLISAGLVAGVLIVLSFFVTGQVRPMATMQDTGAETGVVAVYVTVPSKEVGTKLAGGLVENKLAACVNIVPGVESVYYWEGKVNIDQELMLMIKTRQSLIPQLTAWVKKEHPYDECEVIAIPIIGGSSSYLKWVMDSTEQEQG